MKEESIQPNRFQKKHFISADIQFFMPLIRSSNFRAFSGGKSSQNKAEMSEQLSIQKRAKFERPKPGMKN